MKLKKKLVGGHRICQFLILYLILFFSNSSNSSQIFDYQTEKFIDKINNIILSVNSYNKKNNFKIVNKEFPNAYVTEDNTIFLTSGLILNCPDYIALLAVIAHEIGHIEKYHIAKRKDKINKLKTFNSLGNLATLAGSIIIKQPDLLNAIIVNQTSTNNLFLNFSKEQEIEADFYAVETLNKLNLPKESIKEFLVILENKSNLDIADEELKKFSTHPLFRVRTEMLDYKSNEKHINFNHELENDFKLIKAKFMAYTKIKYDYELKNDAKIYYDSIQYSKSGNLLESLKLINYLISNNNENIFYIETKADILLSYGYNKEAIKFYNKVLIKYPQNHYVRYNIFNNIIFKNKNKKIQKKIFQENLILLELFPNNRNLITKFFKLSQFIEKQDWNIFFEILLFNQNNPQQRLNELLKKTNDYNLKKIIKLYT